MKTRLLALPLALAWPQAAQAADCPSPTTVAGVTEKLVKAEAAFADLDVAAFTNGLDEAALDLPCLGERATPEFSARYHRDVGVRLFTERDEVRAGRAFASARAIDPAYAFPESMVPASHAMRAVYASRDPAAGGAEPLPEPVSGSLALDGIPATERPAQRPALVQVLDASGAVVATRYVFPDDALPPYESREPPPALTAAARAPRPRKAWLYGAAGSAAVSGMLYVLAASAESSFKDTEADHSLEELNALRDRNHLFLYGSAGLGAAAVAGGVIAFVSADW